MRLVHGMLFRRLIARVACCFFVAMSSRAGDELALAGHVPEAVSKLRPLGRLPGNTNLSLSLGLPLRDRDALTNFLRDVSDPGNAQFRHYLTPEEFTTQFGPTEEDYRKVVHFAEAHGLRVKRTHDNRLMVDVTGTVTTVEEAFQTKLKRYRHPMENREFYAPATEPVVDADVPILHISGLDNYTLPHPMDLKIKELSSDANGQPTPDGTTGSGPGGSYTGKDFRPAYVPGVTNTGAGQYIALIEFGAYYAKDIYKYETNGGFPTNIAITNILTDVTGIPSGTNDDDGEETLDIDMSIALARNAAILVYEGGPSDTLMNRIATDNLAKQISCSWGFGIDSTTVQIFQEYAAQGQTFFQASGDGGADLSGGGGLTGEPYSTICGGTALTTTGAGGRWVSETTWGGSGGGISSYGIPAWQEGINMSGNQGSTVNRNYPDVAMLADTVIFWYLKNGKSGEVGGTSASSPQWTAFMALVNQAAASEGKPPVGFANPALYAIGKGNGSLPYAKCFHDITTGNDFSSHNPALYNARVGYDLCTGWGSPNGSNLIAALVGVGTNDFALSASQVGLNVVPGGTATSLISITPMNGFKGTASFSLSGLPPGTSGAFSPTTPGIATILTITTTAATMPKSASLVVVATAGGLTHAITLQLTTVLPIPGATQVSLASYFNHAGFYTDGTTFSGGGLDGGGFAYSASLLGANPSGNNVLFNLGPHNANDVVTGAGQTIALPAGHYTTVQILGTAVNGDQANQVFTITYSDNSTTVVKQNISDWVSPENFAGESVVSTMPYRDVSNGTKDSQTFHVYDYGLTLNETKTVKNIILPNNANVKVLAITLVDGPAAASLAGAFDRAGIYTDGTTFTNPPTRGLDGNGYAYSATFLHQNQTWNGIPFHLAPPNVTNVVSCAGQTIALPAGNYFALRMLATAVNGHQLGQTFTVTYADGSTRTFSQNLSDWFSSQNYAGETKAVPMGYRNKSDGTKDDGTLYLYGYSFALDSSNVVESIRLPSDSNIIVVAMSLVPNWQPVFTVNDFVEPDADVGQPYAATVATNASDMNAGDTITFAKVSGPAWLSIASNGALSGTPSAGDVGLNHFEVGVTDGGGLSATASLTIDVRGIPGIMVGVVWQGTNLLLNWTGGMAPYHVQTSADLATWVDISGAVTGMSEVVSPTNGAAFYRVTGQ